MFGVWARDTTFAILVPNVRQALPPGVPWDGVNVILIPVVVVGLGLLLMIPLLALPDLALLQGKDSLHLLIRQHGISALCSVGVLLPKWWQFRCRLLWC